LARTLRLALIREGYAAPGHEDVTGKVGPTASTLVKFFHDTDKGEAVRIAVVVGTLVQGKVEMQPTIDTKNLVPAGQFEVWLGTDANGRAPSKYP
jgi:hypothetical protein